jgi:hypothetical protein
MREQAAAYRRLTSLCDKLAAALVRGVPEQIESLTGPAERELLSIRARLAQITIALSNFAAERKASGARPVSAETKTDFESASQELHEAAAEYLISHRRAALLTVNGIAFATPCLEMFGLQSTVYRAPLSRPRG